MSWKCFSLRNTDRTLTSASGQCWLWCAKRSRRRCCDRTQGHDAPPRPVTCWGLQTMRIGRDPPASVERVTIDDVSCCRACGRNRALTGRWARQVNPDRTRPVMTLSLGELTRLDRTLCRPKSGHSEGASSHFVDCALNVVLPLEIDNRYSNTDTWQALAQHGVSDRTLRLRLVSSGSTPLIP
jgi:hypothetical protein